MCAMRIKISVLCLLNLHSILIAKKSQREQERNREGERESDPMCAIKRGMGVVAGKGRREEGKGQKSGRGQSKFTFAVKRQRRCVFNIFQRVLPFHVVSSSLSARRGSPEAQRKRGRGCGEHCVEWSILFPARGHEFLYAQLQTKKS